MYWSLSEKGWVMSSKEKKDVNRLGEKIRLNDNKIDTNQNYCGIALRQNAGYINKMIVAYKTSMFHVAGYHDNCLKNQDSRCQYQQDILNKTNSYKDKGALPLDVRANILPVYKNLWK